MKSKDNKKQFEENKVREEQAHRKLKKEFKIEIVKVGKLEENTEVQKISCECDVPPK